MARIREVPTIGGILGTAVAVCALSLATPAHAEWIPNGNPLCVAAGLQSFPRLCTDGAGGALVVWLDGRSAIQSAYASHVLAGGGIASGWPDGGLRLGPDPGGSAHEPRLAPDAAGGAYVLFQVVADDGSHTDLRLFHLTGAGGTAAGWPADGLLVTSTCFVEARSAWIDDDGAGGVYVTWSAVTAQGRDVLLVRYGADGQAVAGWPVEGAIVAGRPRVGSLDGDETSPTVIVDGAGAPWVFYRHWRSLTAPFPGYEVDLRAIRFTPSGTLAPGWNSEGVLVDGIATPNQTSGALAQSPLVLWSAYGEQFVAAGPDSSMEVGWAHFYNDPYSMGCCDHPVRRLSGNNGALERSLVSLCYNRSPARLLPDGRGRLFVVVGSNWAAAPAPPAFDVIDSSAVGHDCITPRTSLGPDPSDLGSIFTDGAFGLLALLTFQDDLRIQHVDSLGVVDPTTLVASGLGLNSAIGIADGNGGFLAVWVDARNGQPDLFVSGSPPASPGPGTTRGADSAGTIAVRAIGPTVRRSAIEFVVTLPDDSPAALDLIDVAGRRVAHLALDGQGAGVHTVRLGAGQVPRAGVYFARLRQGTSQAHARLIVRG